MKLQTPINLPCGATLINRIGKSAMSENLSPAHHGPTSKLIRAYSRWVEGGAGLIITGNVMVDRKAIGEPGNVVVEDRSDMDLLQQWAKVAKGTGIHLWPQLNHPGRQAMAAINHEVVAPSAISAKLPGMNGFLKAPRALEEHEIVHIIERFSETALIFKEAGFTGVQIHGAHGYLISQFLSPLANQRTDRWGGSLENRSRFAVEVYRGIRSKVGPSFPIGIKINSADFQRGGFTEEASMQVVQILEAEGMDLIEISGGTYERPAMMGNKRKSTIEREAYFMEYIEKVRKRIQTPLMLTGGFRTVDVMEKAVADDILDVVGLARPFTLYPDLPKRIFDGSLQYLEVPHPKIGIKQVDRTGFVDITWHEVHIRRLGEGKIPNPDLSPYSIIGHNVSALLRKMLPNIPLLNPTRRRGY